MWTREIMGTDLLHIMECFILYSILGWIVESAYMSFCNKKLTNRGFGFGPFCPIYGWGAVLGYYILHPLAAHPVRLYIVGALIATVFEFFVAVLMKRVLHQVWWDYTDKPFNYQGVICLESTIAWGFYALIIVKGLHMVMLRITYMIPERIGKILCFAVLFLYLLDFTYHVLVELDDDFRMNVDEKKELVHEKYDSFRRRF